MTIREFESRPFWFHDVGDQLKQHIYERSRAKFAAGDRARDAIQSPAQLLLRQEEIRSFFINQIGGLPPSSSPLNSRACGVVDGESFRIEKIVFESRPNVYVTANLYLPSKQTQPTAAVLFLCGHHAEGKAHVEYQAVCQRLVHAGMVVLAQDPIGQGERASYYEPHLGKTVIPMCCPDHDHVGPQLLMLGDSLARYFLHDSMRGIDYLVSRAEVDPTRIGVTGNSGGGTQTAMMMLADSRIAAAAPCTFIMNRQAYQQTGQAQDAEQIWPGFTAAGFDHEDILLAMAPRPTCVLAVKSDFFPIEATRPTVTRASRFFQMLGCADKLMLIEDDGIHRYSDKLARAATDFFAKHLLNTHPGSEPTISALPPASLNCTRSGYVREDFDNFKAPFDENLARLDSCVAQRARPSAKKPKTEAREWLQSRIFHERCITSPDLKFYNGSEAVGDLTARPACWWSQTDLLGHGVFFRLRRNDNEALSLTIAVWKGGTRALSTHEEWIRLECKKNRCVLVLDIDGEGTLQPNAINPYLLNDWYGTIHKLADDLTWIGDDLCALRVFEVIRSIDAAATWNQADTSSVRVCGLGRHAVYGMLASVIDARVQGVARDESMLTSYENLVRDRYYFATDIKAITLRGILEHLDLDDIENPASEFSAF